MVVSVITPSTPGAAGDYALQLGQGAGAAGEVKRQFVRVPAGATAMRVDAAIPDGQYGNVRIQAYNQEGYRIWRSPWLNSETATRSATWFVTGEDLTPGTWELDLVTNFRAVESSACDLTVSFAGFVNGTPGPWRPDHLAGEDPAGSFRLGCGLDQPFKGRAQGMVEGFSRTRRVKTDTDTWEHTFKLNSDLAAVRFRLTLPPGQFGRFTDLAANVLDSDGRAVLRGGLTFPFWTATFTNPHPDRAGSTEYTLQLAGGFADSARGTDWEFELREEYVWKNPVPVNVEREGNPGFSLYPGVWVELDYSLGSAPTVAPVGYQHFGVIRMIDGADGTEKGRLPVTWDFRP